MSARNVVCAQCSLQVCAIVSSSASVGSRCSAMNHDCTASIWSRSRARPRSPGQRREGIGGEVPDRDCVDRGVVSGDVGERRLDAPEGEAFDHRVGQQSLHQSIHLGLLRRTGDREALARRGPNREAPAPGDVLQVLRPSGRSHPGIFAVSTIHRPSVRRSGSGSYAEMTRVGWPGRSPWSDRTPHPSCRTVQATSAKNHSSAVSIWVTDGRCRDFGHPGLTSRGHRPRMAQRRSTVPSHGHPTGWVALRSVRVSRRLCAFFPSLKEFVHPIDRVPESTTGRYHSCCDRYPHSRRA